MLDTRPRLRRSRLLTNSHMIVPHVRAEKIWNAVLSIGRIAPGGWFDDTGARGSMAETMRPAQ